MYASSTIKKYKVTNSLFFVTTIGVTKPVCVGVRCSSVDSVDNPGLPVTKHGRKESEDEFDARYVAYFNRPDIDGWEIRKAMNDMHGMDLVPEPKIIIAALKACRRVNDYALTTRYLEAIKLKCGNKVNEIYPYILQEIKPTLDELGISTLEELGYNEPELHLPNVFAM